MVNFHKKIEKPLGQILVERGVISSSQLQQTLEEQKSGGGLIGELIVKLGFAKEEDIAHCLSLQFSYPFLPLESYDISPEVINVVPKNICRRYGLIPIDKIGSTLTVAMANPLNIQAIENLEDITKCDIQIFVSTPSDIRSSIEKFYPK
ncbi:MAG: hypothetical protein NG737_07705 [Omnitrophica bacterium]|nr:hypothetical protein [Candidatus Omnitrophota bacterium]